MENNFTFEDLSNENGFTFWWASDLCNILNYQSFQSFEKVISRARRAIENVNIDAYTNIVVEERVINSKQQRDFKLSRFACYITIMNASSSKPEVAKAQAYFAHQVRELELIHQDSDQIDRLLIRQELTDGQKHLASTAKRAGVHDYARFQQEGFKGLYDMFNVNLAKKRNVESKKIYETMGRTELAANLFRITQTEERIKNQKLTGQSNLESAHYSVGREVRDLVKKNTGLYPEDLPQDKLLPSVKKSLSKHKKLYKKQILIKRKNNFSLFLYNYH